MKRNTIMAFIAFISLINASCSDKRSNNIEISQSSAFNRKAHIYSVSTKVEITNRYGFLLESNNWTVATKDALQVDTILKNQRLKADSVCNHFN